MPEQHALILDGCGAAGTQDVPEGHALDIFELDWKEPLERIKAQQKAAAEEAQRRELSESTKQSEQARKTAETERMAGELFENIDANHSGGIDSSEACVACFARIHATECACGGIYVHAASALPARSGAGTRICE